MKKVLQVITVPMGYDGVSMFVRRYVAAMNKSALRVDFLAINDVTPRLLAKSPPWAAACTS